MHKKRYKPKIVQIYSPHSEEDINSLYNDVAEILGKPNHYTMLMGYSNAQIDGKTYRNGNGQMWARIQKRKRRHLGKMDNFKTVQIRNVTFQKKAGRRWIWKSLNGVTKTNIYCILIIRPDIVTDITIINQANSGGDRILVMNNIKLDVEVERTN